MIYFAADTHFGHSNIIEYCNRPYRDVHDMDEALIANWNETVGETDEVWHLGDFCHWRKDPFYYVNRLNGRIHLVLGNHDKEGMVDALTACMESVQDVKYLRYQKQRLWLSHYPHVSWRNSHHGSYHLYGHVHGGFVATNRSMDVGVDVNNYRPLSFDEVIHRLESRPFRNHHEP